ncbi:MAG: Ku protein, partial [Dehalococcoidia bacterium]|nr:Ku protein [Dehalococcoidia bacterium]
NYIRVTEDDLARVRLESLKSIQVDNFVPWEVLEDCRRTADKNGYFLAPEEVGAKAFVLFLKAMEAKDVVGIAKIAVREKEQLCAVIPFDGILFLQTLHWEDELREYGDLIPMATVTEKEMAMASALISGMSTPLDWAKYKDNYRERLKEVLEAKIEGREVEALPEIVSTVNDLEAMLKASLAAVGK